MMTVFSAREVPLGAVVQYPAILRRDHNNFRSSLRVTRVNGRSVYGIDLDRPGDTCEFVVTPLQIEENGLVIVALAESQVDETDDGENPGEAGAA